MASADSSITHNRLTHSLRVEQIARSIATRLNTIAEDRSKLPPVDENVVMTAGLAHDLGHPPFGHAGESELNRILTCQKHRDDALTSRKRLEIGCKTEGSKCELGDGFEGNAQTLRVIAVLGFDSRFENGSPRPLGLDLTRRSIAASVKYPWLRGDNSKKPRKWGAYDCDRSILEWVYGSIDGDPASRVIPEAQIMDWADDIAYAVHDVEDFYRTGQLPIGQMTDILGTSFGVFMEYLGSQDELTIGARLAALVDEYKAFSASGRKKPQKSKEPTLQLIDAYLQLFPRKRYTGSAIDIRNVAGARSHLITQFINIFNLDRNGEVVFRPERVRCVNEFFQQLVWYYVIDNHNLAAVQRGQRRVVRECFEFFSEKAKEVWDRPSRAQNTKAERALPRRLVDYLYLARGAEEGWGGYGADAPTQGISRAVVDYISSMSEREIYQVWARLQGDVSAAVLTSMDG